MYRVYVYTVCMDKKTETKKQTTVTLSPSVLAQAKAMGYNISAFLEEHLQKDMKQKMAEQWKKDNAKAIQSVNAETEKRGLLFEPIWMQNDYHGAI